MVGKEAGVKKLITSAGAEINEACNVLSDLPI
jgi:hypothetical protein